jgi:ribonucleoside-diphosphate reductase alpha chain
MEDYKTVCLEQSDDEQLLQEGRCPDCGAPLAHESGCMICYVCGWSACS